MAEALVAILLSSGCLLAQNRELIPGQKVTPVPQGEISWHDASKLGLEGRGFQKLATPFDRLPAEAKKTVSAAVWRLSLDSAGLSVHFETNATELHVRWTLRKKSLAMPHMAATGVSGVDLYVRDREGRWHWLAVGKPTRFPKNEARLFAGFYEDLREFQLYLPLYNGVASLEIGVPSGSEIRAFVPKKKRKKPIVFFGTSITQGGCASRPGMVHTAILGRRLEREVINLGFSGNGRMQESMAKWIREIDAELYVIDCLPNMTGKLVRKRCAHFLELIRLVRPKVPILLVEDRPYANAFLDRDKHARNAGNHIALASEYARLSRGRVQGLHYLRGNGLLGEDGEATVDGSHPTDLGFFRQAAVFEKKLRELLKD